jgi:hypothetical protein
VLALTGAHAGLGGIERSGVPVAVGPLTPLFLGATFAPGEEVVRTARVANAGTASGRFVLSATGQGPLAEELQLTVSNDIGHVVYRGSLAEVDAAHVGILAPGEERLLHLAVELPVGSEERRIAGLTARATFVWSATSV